MFSGMLVGIDKSFKIGDYVTIEGIPEQFRIRIIDHKTNY
jgi:small-conductance mechanosensitive channel